MGDDRPLRPMANADEVYGRPAGRGAGGGDGVHGGGKSGGPAGEDRPLRPMRNADEIYGAGGASDPNAPDLDPFGSGHVEPRVVVRTHRVSKVRWGSVSSVMGVVVSVGRCIRAGGAVAWRLHRARLVLNRVRHGCVLWCRLRRLCSYSLRRESRQPNSCVSDANAATKAKQLRLCHHAAPPPSCSKSRALVAPATRLAPATLCPLTTGAALVVAAVVVVAVAVDGMHMRMASPIVGHSVPRRDNICTVTPRPRRHGDNLGHARRSV